MTYRQTLKQFGFVRVTGKDRVKGIINFIHPKYNWYAEIIKYEYHTACWIGGEKIRCSIRYPGGCYCDTPEDLIKELQKAKSKLN